MPAATRKAAAASTKKQELFFDVDRETKGTFRFKEDAEDGVRPSMGTVYLTKEFAAAIGADKTQSIKITVESVSN